MKLLHGDCLELMKDISDKSIDMILCDLPYGTTACKWDIIIPFEPLWEQYYRITKDGAAIVLFGSQPFTTQVIASNIKNFRYCFYWDKIKPSNYILAKKQPLRIIEDIMVFSTKKYYPIMQNKTGNTEYHEKWYQENQRMNIDGVYSNRTKMPVKYSKEYDCTKKYPTTLLTYTIRETWSKTVSKYHPTQKPVTLLEYLIKTYTLDDAVS